MASRKYSAEEAYSLLAAESFSEGDEEEPTSHPDTSTESATDEEEVPDFLSFSSSEASEDEEEDDPSFLPYSSSASSDEDDPLGQHLRMMQSGPPPPRRPRLRAPCPVSPPAFAAPAPHRRAPCPAPRPAVAPPAPRRRGPSPAPPPAAAPPAPHRRAPCPAPRPAVAPPAPRRRGPSPAPPPAAAPPAPRRHAPPAPAPPAPAFPAPAPPAPRRRYPHPAPRPAPRPGPSHHRAGPSSCPDSLWFPVPQSYEPQVPDFVGSPGIQFDTTGLTELEFFEIFFCEDFVELLVEQTNLYARQFLAKHPRSYFAIPMKWTPVNTEEMRVFWGLTLHMGLVKKPKLRQYWSKEVLYHTPLYHLAMTRERYEVIHKFLHYADNSACVPRDHPSYDRLYKIRPVIEHFGNKFMEMYIPEKYVSIDESLVSFKGRLQFKQYLPSKRARYGFKLYKLCESTSGYTYRFRVYEGKDTRIEPPQCPPILGVTGKIVWELMFPLLDKGYHLYVDNFYTSVSLFLSLFARSTVACGTVKKNQKELPSSQIGTVMRKGERRAFHRDNLLLVKYKDKRDVLMLTTIHGDRVTAVSERGTTVMVQKPDCIVDYNRYMGGVDLSDQVLQPYNALRKTRIWYKKLAVHLVQTALYNAYVLYRCAGHTGKFLEFQEVVIKALVFGGGGAGPSTTPGALSARIVPGQHFPGEIPSTGKKGRTQKKCRVCYKNGIRRDTTYQCDTCPDHPGLCIKECFKAYHTSMDY